MTNLLTTFFVAGLLFALAAVLPLFTDALGNLIDGVEVQVTAGVSCMSSVFNGGAGC